MSQNGYNKTQLARIKAVVTLCKRLIRLLIEKDMSFSQFRELMKRHQTHTPATWAGRPENHLFSITKRWDRCQVDSMPEYLDEKGSPRQLLKSGKNQEAGFDQLVSSVSKDVRPGVILEACLWLNIVEMKADSVVLSNSAFVTNKEFKMHNPMPGSIPGPVPAPGSGQGATIMERTNACANTTWDSRQWIKHNK